MPRCRTSILLLAACRVAFASAIGAQSSHLAEGIAAMEAHDLYGALAPLEAAVREDPGSYAANWRLALTLIDIGNMTPSHTRSPVRDTLYAQAVRYAHHAILAKPDAAADGHFVLADALGHAALTKTSREKIRLATEIRNEALRALAIDPKHDGACHIMGRWNAGDHAPGPGSRSSSQGVFSARPCSISPHGKRPSAYMRLAVQFAPTRIFHRLDLAQVLIDRAEWAEAKRQLDVIAGMPVVDPLDASYKQKAAALDVLVTGKVHE